MYDHRLYGYRKLTEEEQRSAERAISWLLDKRLRPQDIALLTERNLDREAKMINVAMEKGRLIFYRRIKYRGSDFDLYTTEVLPYLKVEKWLFPNMGWLGRDPGFGFHIHTDELEEYIQKLRKNLLLYRKQYDNIEVSTKKLNIQKQIMVGRRIALRA